MKMQSILNNLLQTLAEITFQVKERSIYLVDSAHYQPDWIVNWWTFSVSQMEVRNVAEQFPGLQNEQI